MSYSAIRLTPGMDYSSLVSVANQNFTNLENQTDIYHTVGVEEFDTPTVPSSSPIPVQTLIIPHNLGVFPRYDLFVTAFNRFAGGVIDDFPEDFLVPISFGMQNFSEHFVFNYFVAVDENNMYVTRTGQNISGSAHAVPLVKVHYYVYRERIEE